MAPEQDQESLLVPLFRELQQFAIAQLLHGRSLSHDICNVFIMYCCEAPERFQKLLNPGSVIPHHQERGADLLYYVMKAREKTIQEIRL